MKKVALVALLVAAVASPAFAAQITISGNSDYRSGSGGEFNVVAADAAGAALLGDAVARGYVIGNGTNGTALGVGFANTTGFETFCLEASQYITLPGTYDVSISNGAKPGGAGGNGTIDNISIGTAYLYYQFATGNLAGAGYHYTPGASRAHSAAKLQKAIWFLEDEISLTPTQIQNNTFLQAAFGLYGTAADPYAKRDNNLFGVAVLNLGTAPGYGNQDQLILRVPDGGSTLMLLGGVLVGLGGLRLKFRG
jgi:opacity protein-like surface antigen